VQKIEISHYAAFVPQNAPLSVLRFPGFQDYHEFVLVRFVIFLAAIFL